MSTLPDLPPVPAQRDTVGSWARRLNAYLVRVRDRIRYKITGESAADNGLLLWDQAIPSPVVSINGEWRQLVVADGWAVLSSDTDQTAAAINTAYAISFDNEMSFGGVSLDTDNEGVVFEEGGIYTVDFSVQITSTSASTKNLWFWPKINNVDVPGSTIKVSMHNNGGTIVMTRSATFSVSDGDILKAYWATDDTSVTLDASAATAFAPAAPSVTLSITRIMR